MARLTVGSGLQDHRRPPCSTWTHHSPPTLREPGKLWQWFRRGISCIGRPPLAETQDRASRWATVTAASAPIIGNGSVSLRQAHAPGEKLFVDYAGPMVLMCSMLAYY